LKPGIRAYHGSPHDFERFDSSKIGTGEGAQAYGHGDVSVGSGMKPAIDEFSQKWTDRGVRNFIADRPNRGEIQLSDIVVPKDRRGSGIGTEFMNELTQLADESGRRLTLTAAKDFGTTSLPRLKAFYKRFGFVENKGRNTDFTISDSMYRPPKPLAK
jgi:GNAT superfamily N-acetyltransferase